MITNDPISDQERATTIEEHLELPCAYFFHLNGRKQNEHFRFDGIFVTFPKSQIVLFNITGFEENILSLI